MLYPVELQVRVYFEHFYPKLASKQRVGSEIDTNKGEIEAVNALIA